jgi:sugar/nucleoside kinase (ribokinase family)
MPKIFDVITIGGATRDIIFYTDEGELVKGKKLTQKKLLGFEFGAKINLKKVNFNFGGGAANSAVAFSHLGLRTAAILTLGQDDNGLAIKKNLARYKVDTRFVRMKKNLATGFSFILTDEKSREHIAFLYRGANNDLEFRPKDLGKIKNKWFYVGSLSGSNWQRILNRLTTVMKGSREPKIKLAWNPGARQFKTGLKNLAKFLKVTDVLLVNRDEALELVLSVTGASKKIDQPEILLKILKKYGPRIVVITDGAKGAYAFDGQSIYHAKTLNFRPVDTTGVGDAFGSSFVAGLILFKEDIIRALKLAIINSSFELMEVGAETGLIKLGEAKKWMSKVKIKKYKV